MNTLPWWTLGEPIPSPNTASKEGIVALSENLEVEQLLIAYRRGVFPWYNEYDPVIWWCPDPRFVLFPQELIISKSMQRLLRNKAFEVTYNLDFSSVIRKCAEQNRKGQEGTWIIPEMIDAFEQLHQQGIAISCEVWLDAKMVGGLYGVKIGNMYYGESMYYEVSNASKFGFISLVKKLQNEGVQLIDCQVYTKHLESLGGRYIARVEFLKYVDGII